MIVTCAMAMTAPWKILWTAHNGNQPRTAVGER